MTNVLRFRESSFTCMCGCVGDRREVCWEAVLGRNNGASHFWQSRTLPSITHDSLDSMHLFLGDSRAKEPTIWKEHKEVWHRVCLPALLPSVFWHFVKVKLLCFRIQGWGRTLEPGVENTWVIVFCYSTVWAYLYLTCVLYKMNVCTLKKCFLLLAFLSRPSYTNITNHEGPFCFPPNDCML